MAIINYPGAWKRYPKQRWTNWGRFHLLVALLAAIRSLSSLIPTDVVVFLTSTLTKIGWIDLFTHSSVSFDSLHGEVRSSSFSSVATSTLPSFVASDSSLIWIKKQINTWINNNWALYSLSLQSFFIRFRVKSVFLLDLDIALAIIRYKNNRRIPN